MLKRKICIVLMCLSLVLLLCGCSSIRITTGFEDGEFAKIGETVVPNGLFMLMLSEEKAIMEQFTDQNIWKEKLNDTPATAYATSKAASDTVNLVLVGLMADKWKIKLSNEDEALAESLTQKYMEELSPSEYNFTRDDVKTAYLYLLKKSRLFDKSTEGVDTDISVDETRIIEVQYIYISTVKKVENDKVVPLSDAEISRKRIFADGIYEEVVKDGDFSVYIDQYSESDKKSREFGTGDWDETIEKAAFALETGDISKPVQAGDGFYILKCINENVGSEYQKRADEIINQRKNALFDSQFEAFKADKKVEYDETKYKSADIIAINKSSGRLNIIYKECV